MKKRETLMAQGPVDVNVRPCTCHPDDRPPRPCAKQYALAECRDAAWWALVMGAAAALEDAANCLSDPDAKRAAEGATKHYRTEANALWPN